MDYDCISYINYDCTLYINPLVPDAHNSERQDKPHSL